MKKLLFTIFWGWLACVTIVAQNEPYISGTSLVKIYSSDGRIGMMLEPWVAPEGDVLNLKGGDYITVTAATLDSYYVVSGKLVLALVRGNKIVKVLATTNISSISAINFVYFSCKISEDTEVKEGDEIRLLTTYDGVMYSTVDAAYGNDVVDRIPAVGYKIPLFNINYPSHVDGVSITPSNEQAWADKAVKGRNFYLYINKENEDDVLVVKANGKAWVEQNGVYMLSGVMQDYDIDIKVYKQGECTFYREITTTPETRVKNVLLGEELDYTRGLKVKGMVRVEDFPVFRDEMPSLEVLDLSEATIENDYLPESAFEMNMSIQEIRLPEGLVGLSNNAFRYVKKLAHIVLPKSLNTFGYNAFFGCESLKTVWVKWNPIEVGIEPALGYPIPPCAFRATTYMSDGTLIVPKGCLSAYKNASVWGDFKTIRETKPVDFMLELPFDRFLPDEDAIADVKENEIKVNVRDGKCIISQKSPDKRNVAVVDLSGCCLVSTTMSDVYHEMTLKAGLYVVKVDGKSYKILVP